mmetsp:Transcript_44414/g.73688  ORF Transcript_44414/g.73688 Transcript_44414/m.73688 type:complete len:256 (-) Transcript_44414:1180-1947(-)
MECSVPFGSIERLRTGATFAPLTLPLSSGCICAKIESYLALSAVLTTQDTSAEATPADAESGPKGEASVEAAGAGTGAGTAVEVPKSPSTTVLACATGATGCAHGSFTAALTASCDEAFAQGSEVAAGTWSGAAVDHGSDGGACWGADGGGAAHGSADVAAGFARFGKGAREGAAGGGVEACEFSVRTESSFRPPAGMESNRVMSCPMSLPMIASSCASSLSSSFLNLVKSRQASLLASVLLNLLTSGKSPTGML